jgi:hypothetical protein
MDVDRFYAIIRAALDPLNCSARQAPASCRSAIGPTAIAQPSPTRSPRFLLILPFAIVAIAAAVIVAGELLGADCPGSGMDSISQC